MIMKKVQFLIITFLFPLAIVACPECERNQPEILKGVGHGAGPEQQWDYVIVILTSIIVLVSLYYSIKWIIKPGEKKPSHIKRKVLNFD